MPGWNWVGAVAAVAVLSACAGAPKLSDDGRMVRDVTVLVAELQRAYQDRDAAAFMAGVADGFPDREAFRQNAERAFKQFDRIDLALTVDRVHLEGKSATVYLHWDARWRAPVGVPLSRQGNAQFLVDTDGGPALAGVDGDNPFAIPSASAS